MSRALELDPEARFPNACALAFELRRVVLSMGVGDGRYFLRSALEREWFQYAEEITTPRGAWPSTNDDDGGYEPYDGELVAIEPRAKRRK